VQRIAPDVFLCNTPAMPDYRRAWHPGGTYFFTVNLLHRNGNDLLIRHIELLREAVSSIQRRHPFSIHGWVVLPEHMHCIIELPLDDDDYAKRWRLIKTAFSRALPHTETLSQVRAKRGERGIWQRRYWEHLIRDDRDYRAHMDYIHINPVKHGLVRRVADWPYSTFHRLVTEGVYPGNWGGGNEGALRYGD
jgi:REP-associated tyrosine transposase